MRQVGRLCVGCLWLAYAPFMALAGAPRANLPHVPPTTVPHQESSVRAGQLRGPVRFPAEFERQGALLLGCHELVREFPDTLADVVGAVDGRVPVVALVMNREDRDLVVETLDTYGLRTDRIHFAAVPHNTMWARDYGPILVRQSNGRRAVVDGHYGLLDRDHDECVPQLMATCLRMPLWRVPIQIEGGNLLTNGNGLCVTTTSIIDDNAERGFDEPTITTVFNTYLGASQVVFLEPLVDEPTGHADMFVTFTGRDTVVVGAYDPQMDPTNAAVLDRNAARLARVRIPGGRLRVVRIPMPPNDDGVWRTYTNVVYANGVTLVPVFGRVDVEAEQHALALYGALLPGWRIAPIDVSDLISLGGALHCIALNLDIPGQLPKFPQPARRRAEPLRSRGWHAGHLSSHLPKRLRSDSSNIVNSEQNASRLNPRAAIP